MNGSLIGRHVIPLGEHAAVAAKPNRREPTGEGRPILPSDPHDSPAHISVTMVFFAGTESTFNQLSACRKSLLPRQS
jgi:hypothetical protein